MKIFSKVELCSKDLLLLLMGGNYDYCFATIYLKNVYYIKLLFRRKCGQLRITVQFSTFVVRFTSHYTYIFGNPLY